jgi:hypothetical protein
VLAYFDLHTVRHIPEWFPGAGFQKTAKKMRKTLNDLAERPFAFVKSQMVGLTTSFLCSL